MRPRTLVATTLLAAPALALSHPGHAPVTGFAGGFLHPFTGADHFAAMLAVGLWSALTLRRARWLAPLAFAAMLLVGALAGRATPLVEPTIAASLLALGLLVATRFALPPALGALVVGGFALAHGAAHAGELQGASAVAGLVMATAVLHLAGLAAGQVLRERRAWLAAAVGTGIALLGAAALVA